MNIMQRPNAKGDKTFLSLEWGRGAGKRLATGIFLFTKPQNQAQKKHNQEALLLIETKRSELMLEQQATGSGFIPSHKILPNFLDYYGQFVQENLRKGNRHLENSLSQFQLFIGKSFLSPSISRKISAAGSGNSCSASSLAKRRPTIFWNLKR
jgi:hypothetical protein